MSNKTAFKSILPVAQNAIKIVPLHCSCGAIHGEIPAGIPLNEDLDCKGYVWNCECRTTLWVPLEYAKGLIRTVADYERIIKKVA